MSRIDDCRVIQLPKHMAPQGNLTSIQSNCEIPFDIARVYYLYDLPSGESRGGHTHRELQQLMVCVMGALDVVLDDGLTRRTIRLDRADQGLLIQPMVWRELEHFSSGVICLVLASHVYLEEDYIRNYQEFLALAASMRAATHPPQQ